MDRRNFVEALGAIGATGVVSARAEAHRHHRVAGTPIVDGLDVSVLTEEYLGMLRKAGVSCWHKSMDGLRSFSDAYNFLAQQADKATIVRSVADIHAAHQQNKVGVLFGWQSADELSGPRGGPNDWWSDPPRSNLRAYWELGLRVCGIAYQIANAFGGGGIDPHVGLSRAGRRLVEEIHKFRIVLDVGGHTGDQTSLDALAMSSGVPIICSHAGIRALANSSRNLSDRVMDAIAATGGVIGIVAINDFLVRGKEMATVAETPLGTVERVLDHVEYVRKRVGVDHVGLGPDFTWGMSTTRDYALFGPDVMDRGPRKFVTGFANITELPNVVRGLERRGWTAPDVDKFLGGNWLRVYQRVWGA